MASTEAPNPGQDDAVSFSDPDASDFEGFDADSAHEEPHPPTDYDDVDSDEEALEKLVLGDTASFRQQLFSGEGIDGSGPGFGADGNAGGDAGGDHGIEDVDDALIFMIDAPKAGSKAPVGALERTGTQSGQEDAPAWQDSDDDRLEVSLATVSRLRKLRVAEEDDVVTGTEYMRRLRQQYVRLNGTPDWAKVTEGRTSQRRRRSSAAASDDSDISGASDEVDDSLSTLPLDDYLRDASRLRERSTTRAKTLRPEVIDIQRSRDMASSHKEAVTSLSFHPKYPVLLSSSTSTMLYLHHLSPTAHPTPNPLLTSAQVKQVPVRHAEFLYPAGDRILFAGRRRFIHSWDLPSGLIQKTERMLGHQLEQRSWERFKLSPCGRYMGVIASARKGGGIIHVVDTNSMQWTAEARLDSRGGISDFCWWGNGNGLTILGKSGQVGEWSIASRRFVGIWNDEGSVCATALALGGRNGPELLGGDRWVAVGSSSGIMNVYDREGLIVPSGEEELDIKARPEPRRSFGQMITAITFLTFSPDGQLLAFGSKHKKDGLRLAHLPSCTVYRNWPTEQTPLGRITAVAFGRQSDMLAVGNDVGKIRTWEIRC